MRLDPSVPFVLSPGDPLPPLVVDYVAPALFLPVWLELKSRLLASSSPYHPFSSASTVGLGAVSLPSRGAFSADSFLRLSPLVPLLPAPPKPPELKGSFAFAGVLRYLSELCMRPYFSGNYLRQLACSLLASPPATPRPSALCAQSMATPALLHSGLLPLPQGRHNFDLSVMAALHVESCSLCFQAGTVLSSCYFFAMLRSLVFGHLPVFRHAVCREAPYSGSYPRCDLLVKSFDREVVSYAQRNLSQVCSASLATSLHMSSFNIVLKHSALSTAFLKTGIHIHDQVSLSAANALLDPSLLVSVRPVLDLSGSGVNDAVIDYPFSQSTVHHAVSLMSPNCYMGIMDFSKFFQCFPLANEFRPFVSFEHGGDAHTANRIFFGMKSAPAFCCLWSAEFRRWLLHLAMLVAHMTDDYFSTNQSFWHLLRDMHTMVALFKSFGLAVNPAKFQLSQQVSYLGFRLDSVAFTLGFTALNASCCLLQLEAFVVSLSSSVISFKDIERLAGKLNNLASLLQRGRLHIRSFYRALRTRPIVSPSLRAYLLRDSAYWVSVLSVWSAGSVTGHEFQIFNSLSLRQNPALLHFVVSDASGLDDHGCGFYHGDAFTLDPLYYAQAWSRPASYALPLSLVDDFDFSVPDVVFNSSHYGELAALLLFLRSRSFSRGVLLWISDSQSAVWSVNKGYCDSDLSFRMLRTILQLCDDLSLVLVAIWTPRAENTLADYLSHLSFLSSRSSVSGSVSEISASASAWCARVSPLL